MRFLADLLQFGVVRSCQRSSGLALATGWQSTTGPARRTSSAITRPWILPDCCHPLPALTLAALFARLFTGGARLTDSAWSADALAGDYPTAIT